MIKTKNYMMVDLIAGNIIFGIAVGIITLFLAKNILQAEIGLIVGVLLSCLAVWHMNSNVQSIVGLSENEALKHTRIAVIIRFFVGFGMFFVLYYFKLGNVIMALLGLFSLKFSAYVNPFVHRLLVNRLYTRKG